MEPSLGAITATSVRTGQTHGVSERKGKRPDPQQSHRI